MINALDHSRLKVVRAQEHFDAFKCELGKYHDSKPWSKCISGGVDMQPRDIGMRGLVEQEVHRAGDVLGLKRFPIAVPARVAMRLHVVEENIRGAESRLRETEQALRQSPVLPQECNRHEPRPIES